MHRNEALLKRSVALPEYFIAVLRCFGAVPQCSYEQVESEMKQRSGVREQVEGETEQRSDAHEQDQGAPEQSKGSPKWRKDETERLRSAPLGF